MDQKTLTKRKTSRCKILHKYSSKKMYSCFDSNALIASNRAKGRKSKTIKGCSLNSQNNNFTEDRILTNATNIDEQTIRDYADVLAKTEKIWSQSSSAFEKETFSISSEYTVMKSNALYQKQERNLKINSPPKKTDVKGKLSFWESAVWKNLSVSPKCEVRYSADDLLTEIKSLVPEDQPTNDIKPDLSECSSVDKDLEFSAEHISLEKFDYLDKLLDDDSAYGSDESLPRSSPEPTDDETGFPRSSPEPTDDETGFPRSSPEPTDDETGFPRSSPEPTDDETGFPRSSPEPTDDETRFPRSSPEPTGDETGFDVSVYDEILEDCAGSTKSDSETKLNTNMLKDIISNKFYSKLCIDEDFECICGDSDCDMHTTGEFREFLKGLASTKPRKVLHETQKCVICKKKIGDEFSLLNRFGLLLNCEHPFCYNCIFSYCYRKKAPVSIFKVRCPVCNAFSPGIVSSPRWIKSKIKKTNMFRELKLAYIEWLIFKSYLNGTFKILGN